MTKQLTIEQRNEVIAKFMGVKPYEDSRYGMLYNSPVDGKTCFSLVYHSDWSWLMPVVEKINRTMIPDNKYPASVIIFKTTCHINDDQYIIVETSSQNLIQCVHEAVFLFIHWLNKQQQ
jgi:hypothetical protein